MERRYPTYLPELRPVPEYRAPDDLATLYGEVKRTLQVPWMGVVAMAFAHHREFFSTLWSGLRPLCGSRPFVEAARELRRVAEEGVATLDPPPIAGRLAAMGYAERELAEIRATVEVFSHGNQPYLLIATLARLLLEGGEPSPVAEAPAFQGRHGPDAAGPLVLMEAHHADAPTRLLYEDVKATLRLPVVNTDYRALARWPSYFAAAWGDLRPLPGGEAHEALCREIHARAAGLAAGLPNPGGLSGEALRRAATRPAAGAAADDVIETVRLFQWLLPGLVANVAFFRAQLG
jgi:hypothetical protein